MLGNYEVKDGKDTLRPEVTAQLFTDAIAMWKQFGRPRRWGFGAVIAILFLLTF